MKEVTNFESWELEWQAAHVQRFWDWWGRNPAKSRLYFSRLVGDAILDEVSRYVGLTGVVVDLGAGPGHMMDKLLRRGLDALAVDSSVASVELLNARLKGRPHFLGAEASPIERMAVSDETVNIALLVETVEHLNDEILSSVLSEAYRTLKPEGVIVITTPNEEDLVENQVMCPNCGCVFHTVQHVRSLSRASLGAIMKTTGFREVVCEATLFSWHPPFMRPLHRLSYKLRRKSFPHLLYIGRK